MLHAHKVSKCPLTNVDWPEARALSCGSGFGSSRSDWPVGEGKTEQRLGVVQKKSSEAKSAKRRPVIVFGVITTQILWMPFFHGSGT
jgi:hypothetical protein